MTFEKKKDAEAYEAKVRDGKSTGVVVRPKQFKTTFKQWSETWLNPRKKRKPGTQESYEANMRKHILPQFGGMRLYKIQPDDVQDWVWALSDKGLAPRTVHLIFKTFRACINSAVRKRTLTYSPCIDIELPEIKRRKVVPATREQVWALCEAMPSHARALILVGVGCGLRSGEAFGLCLDSVNFEAGTLTVRRQVIKVKSKTQLVDYNKTETSHEREVPLPAFVHRALLDHLDRFSVLRLENGAEVIFRSQQRNVIRRDHFYRTFKRALEKAGLPADFRFHDLRHSFASHALDQGVSEATVQLYMGHASANELKGTYHHQVLGAAARDRTVLEAVFMAETDGIDIPTVVEEQAGDEGPGEKDVDEEGE
ncbi:tyrosine-type recombinase/integrase [Kitasatospora sp. NPDC087861]|uniref:tyrosine-type recombinase/integrase n=1 Tax=Kitasatospora sp. NPDC087861 TaxID=3364070 RepID=UPI00382B0C73